MPDPTTRTLIYLLVGNTLGVILSRSIEMRERHLFQQRRTLEDAQSELQRRSSTAEEASAEKSRLVAAIGHDLRQPMMAAVLHLSVLIRRVRARDVTGVERQADRVNDAVLFLRDSLEHLLLSARYDAGVGEVWTRPVSLNQLLEKLSDLCDSRASPQMVRLIIHVPHREVMISTDPQVLLRVLVNLVDNALKFARVDDAVESRVMVRAVIRNGECRIAVLDNGVGIAGSDLESIWQPYSQVKDNGLDRLEGLGLGLYLVQRLLLKVEGHRIRVRSFLGKCTCFVVTLPAVAELAGPSEYLEPANWDSEVEGSRGIKDAYVLLVEDDPEARLALSVLFAEWGVLCSSGESLAEALELHGQTERRVDAIIADYRLAGACSGIDCILSARTSLGYCPDAVLMTAEVEVELLADQLPEKCVLLKKPFDSSVLFGLLHAALIAALAEEREGTNVPPNSVPVHVPKPRA